MKKQWWHDKVAYQIYPKSFMDSNVDGIGDLRGIISKLDYLKELGVDIIWLSPIYKSPFVDQGYDISDYYAIGEQFGTMEEFDELIAETKKRNMYVLMDLVVNHCSSEHEWFKKAMTDPEGEYGDYFYIRESKDGQPINNARSYFGGNIWEPIPGTNKYYLHMFAKEQPDLNWENPKVRQEIYKMVNWWLDKGIAGFRVDAINFIKKDQTGGAYAIDYPTHNEGRGIVYPASESNPNDAWWKLPDMQHVFMHEMGHCVQWMPKQGKYIMEGVQDCDRQGYQEGWPDAVKVASKGYILATQKEEYQAAIAKSYRNPQSDKYFVWQVDYNTSGAFMSWLRLYNGDFVRMLPWTVLMDELTNQWSLEDAVKYILKESYPDLTMEELWNEYKTEVEVFLQNN